MTNRFRIHMVGRAAMLLAAVALLAVAGCVRGPIPAAPGGPQVNVGDSTPVVVPVKPPSGDPTSPAGDPGKINPEPKDGETISPQAPVLPSVAGKRYALLVGVKDYDSPDFRNLNFTEADVEDLAKALRADGYADENIVLMTKKDAASDPQLTPTVDNIRTQLDRLLKRCDKDDVVFVGLTGHGIQPKDGKQFFCGYQAMLADSKDAEPKTLLPIDEVYQKLGACPAALKLLLVDACRDDPESKGARRVSDDYKTVTSGPTQAGVIALFSCSEGESSWEPTELGHGVFFHFLIEGLQGKADLRRDGRITWTELVDYVVSNVDLYAVSRLRQRQRPHFKGESNVVQPLAVRPATNDPTMIRSPEVKLKMIEGVLLDEDFLKAPLGGPPGGWDGDDFSVVKDSNKRALLECNKQTGEHFIALPRLQLKGDFYVEVQTLLDGAEGNLDPTDHQCLTVELAGGAGANRVRTTVNNSGYATVQNGAARRAENFKPYEIMRARLTREGGVYRVHLNGEIATGQKLEYTGEFDTVRLGLTSGIPYHRALNTTAKIYSVKVGLLNSEVGPSSPSPTTKDRFLLNEDLKKTPLGGPPMGWEGDAFSAVKDSNGRACLEVNKKAGYHYLTPPRMALKGDFYVEVETLLDGGGNDHEADIHRLQVVLEARGGAVRVPITVSDMGNVTVGVNGQERKPANFKPYQITRVRIARQGKVLQVTVNDDVATGAPLDYTGDFDTIRLGLTAGIPYHNALNTTAKIYSVKVGLPGDGPLPPPPPALPEGVHEDFSKVNVGSLPDGWTSSPLRNLLVQQSDERKNLELTNAAAGNDLVSLPKVDLSGNFYIEYEVQFHSPDAAVTLQLAGGPKVRSFLVQLDGRGGLAATGAPKADLAKNFLDEGRPNVLGIERTEKAYIVKLNETQVGALPLAAGPGPYTAVGLLVGLKDKDQKSPHINSVRVQPLPAANP